MRFSWFAVSSSRHQGAQGGTCCHAYLVEALALTRLYVFDTTGVREFGGNPKVAHLISLCVLFPLDTCRIDSLNVQ